jgi:two-component system LytT family response regulator
MTGPADLKSVRALICEDEPLAIRALREYLRDVSWIEVVGEARDGRKALRLIHKLEPDLVFMDVRMPGLTGVEVLEAVDNRPAVVFTTAFDEYAISAFELGAVDYLVKPFGRDRLVQTLDRVRVRLVGEARAAAGDAKGVPNGESYPTRIFARHRGAMIPVTVADIRHVDAVDGGVSVVTPEGAFDLDVTLGEVAGRLNPDDFVRVHRAHLVNLAHVVSIRRYDQRRLSLRLDNDTAIVGSRRGSQLLREVMEV